MENKRVNRRLKYGALSVSLTVFVLAAAILLNVVMGVLDSRFDLTADFSVIQTTQIDEVSEAYVEEFNKTGLHVELIVNGNESEFKKASYDVQTTDTGASSSIFSAKRYTYELMQSFMSKSDNIEVHWIDVRYNPQFFKERGITVSDTTFITVYCEETKRSFLIDESVFDDSEYIGLERRIDGGIKNVTSEGLRTIGVIRDHGESVDSYLWDLAELNGYNVEFIDLYDTEEISDDISFVIICNPTVTYNSEDIKKLDAYLNPAVKGETNDGDRSLIVFADADMPQNPLLEDYLSTIWGIRLGSYMAFDPSNSNSILSVSEPSIRVNYTSTGPSLAIAGELADVKNYLNLTLGKARNLELTFETNSDGVQTTTLLKTFDANSFGIEIGTPVDPTDFKNISRGEDDIKGPLTVGAMSYKQGSYDNGDQYGLTSSNVLVFGSTSLLDTYYLSNIAGNTSSTSEYVLSMLAYLSGNENVVKITAKSFIAGTLEFGSDVMTVVISSLVIGLVPVICVAVAVIRWRKRKYL